VLYSVLGHALLFFFEEKRKSWKINLEKMDETELNEAEISLHTVLLRGLNKDIPIKDAKSKIHTIFEDLLEDTLIDV
jgi:hypothetical protein